MQVGIVCIQVITNLNFLIIWNKRLGEQGKQNWASNRTPRNTKLEKPLFRLKSTNLNRLSSILQIRNRPLKSCFFSQRTTLPKPRPHTMAWMNLFNTKAQKSWPTCWLDSYQTLFTQRYWIWLRAQARKFPTFLFQSLTVLINLSVYLPFVQHY